MNTKHHLFTNHDLKNLIVPLLFEQLLMILVGLADTLMISFAGDAAVSGVTLVNMFVVFFLYVFTALAAGGAVIISQYIGRHDLGKANHAAGQLVTVLAVASAICTVIVLVFNYQLLRLLFGRVEDDVMAACMTYQRISALSFVPLGVYNAGAALCRSINKTGATLRISIVSNIVNVVGNAIGIFVLHAGVAGVAWPTMISRVVSAVMVVMFCIREDNQVFLAASDIFTWNSATIKSILSVAIPNSIENGTFQLIKVALSSVTALFGTAQIAANGIAQTIWSLSALFILVMGPVYITVIGQCMGAGDIGEAEFCFRKLTKITFAGSFVWNAVILALTPLLLRIYPLSSEITDLIFKLVLIHNVFNTFAWPIGGAMSYGLRAAGDVRFAMIVTILSTVFARLLTSIVLAVYLNLGVIGIALGMACDWIARSIAIALRYRSGKWKQFKVV